MSIKLLVRVVATVNFPEGEYHQAGFADRIALLTALSKAGNNAKFLRKFGEKLSVDTTLSAYDAAQFVTSISPFVKGEIEVTAILDPGEDPEPGRE